jgi:hypothetical protein
MSRIGDALLELLEFLVGSDSKRFPYIESFRPVPRIRPPETVSAAPEKLSLRIHCKRILSSHGKEKSVVRIHYTPFFLG